MLLSTLSTCAPPRQPDSWQACGGSSEGIRAATASSTSSTTASPTPTSSAAAAHSRNAAATADILTHPALAASPGASVELTKARRSSDRNTVSLRPAGQRHACFSPPCREAGDTPLGGLQTSLIISCAPSARILSSSHRGHVDTRSALSESCDFGPRSPRLPALPIPVARSPATLTNKAQRRPAAWWHFKSLHAPTRAGHTCSISSVSVTCASSRKRMSAVHWVRSQVLLACFLWVECESARGREWLR